MTVYSQQVRALNLIWALSRQATLKSQSIVIVGGGVAGVTAAAAAMLNGAHVTLLERHDELLHLQRGCHTRYLHPRIYEWPHRDARRASAQLPILNWSVGSASDVATRILADYHRIRLHCVERQATGATLEEITKVRNIHISKDGSTIMWDGARPRTPRAIILTIGFGIERTVAGLPRRSYWRVDSLTQTPLDSMDHEYLVLVAGTGDGGIIDVLRASLKEFDHGGFLDECVLCLEKDVLRRRIKKIERDMRVCIKALGKAGKNKAEIDCEVSEWLHWQYSKLSTLNKVDALLEVVRPMTRIVWVGRPPYPVSPYSQALNRILGWKLWIKWQSTGHVQYMQGELKGVRVLDQESSAGYRYQVDMTCRETGLQIVHAHQVVVRYGCHSALGQSFPHIEEALGNRVSEIINGVEPAVRECYKTLYNGVCTPHGTWREDIRICAAPEYEGPTAWRIRLWLESESSLDHVSWIDYDLHPEYGAVQRRAIWTKGSAQQQQKFRHWINAWDDFWIRIRCSDGLECGDWLSNALQNTDVDLNGKRLSQSDLRDKCVNALRSAVRNARGDEYYKHPWCSYVDPPLRVTGASSPPVTTLGEERS